MHVPTFANTRVTPLIGHAEPPPTHLPTMTWTTARMAVGVLNHSFSAGPWLGPPKQALLMPAAVLSCVSTSGLQPRPSPTDTLLVVFSVAMGSRVHPWHPHTRCKVVQGIWERGSVSPRQRCTSAALDPGSVGPHLLHQALDLSDAELRGHGVQQPTQVVLTVLEHKEHTVGWQEWT